MWQACVSNTFLYWGGGNLNNLSFSMLEKRIRRNVSIDDMQFGVMAGKGTTGTIFMVRQVQESHQAKKLCYAFVYLENAFVQREVVRWALRMLGVNEWFISQIERFYFVYTEI